MSIYDWIESRIPGATRRRWALLDVAYAIEFGADTTTRARSASLYLLGYGPRRTLSVFGPSDERYRIEGGIDLVTSPSPATWATTTSNSAGSRVHCPRERRDLHADLRNHGAHAVRADVVTWPCVRRLRTLDYAGAVSTRLKDRAIRELGAGKEGKLHVQFTRPSGTSPGPWGVSGGTAYGDTGFQVTWDATRGQAGQSGIW